jgi:hypothetical protein
LFEEFLATQDEIIEEQIDLLGKLPLEWWEEWAARNDYFSESGGPRTGRWENYFEGYIQNPRREAGMPVLEKDEEAAVLGMMRSMVCFKPEERSTMQDILKCDWMVKWGLPEYNKSRVS